MRLVTSCCMMVVCGVHSTRRNRYWALYREELVASGHFGVLYIVYVENMGTSMTSCIGKGLLISLRLWLLYGVYRKIGGTGNYDELYVERAIEKPA